MFDVFRAKLENGRVKLPDELASAGEKIWMVYEWKVGKKHFFKCIILNVENYEEFLASEKNNISDMEQSVCEAIGYVSLAIGFGLNVAGGGFIIKGIRCFADTLDGAGGIPFAPLSADSTANHSRSDQTTEEAEETEETAEAEEDLSEYDVRFYREGGANNLVHIKIDDMNSKNLASDDEFTITLSRGNHTVLLYNGIKESKIRFDLKSNTQIEVNTLMGKPYIKSFTGSKVYKM